MFLCTQLNIRYYSYFFSDVKMLGSELDDSDVAENYGNDDTRTPGQEGARAIHTCRKEIDYKHLHTLGHSE